MKKILFAAASAAALMAGPAIAEEEAAGPWSVSGTVSLTNNYVFRGFTQTLEDPAIQAGVTLAHESGFYAGFWGSNVDFGDGESDLETDFYVGYGGALGENTSFDLNVTYYAYPGTPGDWDYDYVEFIGGITHDFGVATVGVKGAYSPEFFGHIGDAFWLGGNLTVPLGDYFSVSGNIGEQWFDDEDFDDYFHYDVGVTATYEGVSLDLRYIGTDIKEQDEYFVATLGFGF
jgi:uncharacterized protein (TIGR02001 family)